MRILCLICELSFYLASPPTQKVFGVSQLVLFCLILQKSAMNEPISTNISGINPLGFSGVWNSSQDANFVLLFEVSGAKDIFTI